MTPNGGSRDGSQQQRQTHEQPSQAQAGSGHPYWELNRLSTTGRHFLLEPESRTGIVQDLQHRLQREQRRRREQQLRSNNNTQQQQQQEKDGDDQQPSGESAGEASEAPTTAASLQEVQESSVQAVASTPVMATSVAAEEVEPMSAGKKEQETSRRSSLQPEALVDPAEKVLPAVVQPEESSQRSTTQSVTIGMPIDPEQASEKSRAQMAAMRSVSGKPVLRAPASVEDSASDRQGTAWRNNPKSASRASVPAGTPVPVAVDSPAVDRQELAWNNHTKTATTAPEPAQEAAVEGSSAADRQGTMRRNSMRSMAAATTTAATETGGQMSTITMALLPSQPIPPCLQCLMRSLHESGLLGSCWMTAVLELEEAFAIKEVADACGSRFRESEVNLKLQQPTMPRRRPSKLQMQSSIPQGVISSGEGSAATPQADVSKWQALERLCYLRNSLRECPHVVES